MPRIDSEKFYNAAINKYGISPRGLNWNSKENQTLRFDAIIQLLPKELHNSSIVDAGCGFGDFYFHLKNSKKTPKEYIGIDSLTSMYTIASTRTRQNILLADITKDYLPYADYYISSGALNVLTKFETHQFIHNCYKSSKHGFIFNILYGDKVSQTYNYLNSKDIKELASNLNIKKWRQINNYMQNDITIGFFK
jgi:SAM-dependent methyltransferase